MFSGFERISRATVKEVAAALKADGLAIPPHAGKRWVAWAATRKWPELYGWTREGTIRAAAERLGIKITYRGHDASNGGE